MPCYKPKLLVSVLAALTLHTVHAADLAEYVSQTVPNRVEGGKTYPVSVTMRKPAGSDPWGPSYALVSKHNQVGWFADNNWIRWNPTNVTVEGDLHIFHFNMTVPAYTSGIPAKELPFQWQMLHEGTAWFGDITPNANLELYYAPPLTTRFPPKVAPTPVAAADFSFNSYRGANVLQSGIHKPHVSGWFPTEAEMHVIAEAAVNMKLNYLRIAVSLPADTEMVTYEKVPGTGVVTVPRIDPALDATRMFLDIAYKYGLKTVVALTGYNGYERACLGHGRWSFLETQNNAKTLVRGIAGHPGLLAWDISNEPMWTASEGECLKDGVAAYQDVVDGVHAMYNVVRANDPGNKPTTVGDYPIPFVKYWKDISSFSSPHFYVQIDRSSPTWRSDLKATVASTVQYYKQEIPGIPMIIGEFGFSTKPNTSKPENVQTEAERADAYRSFYAAVGANAHNVGTSLWNLSTGDDEQHISLLYRDGTLKEAGREAVAVQWNEQRDAAFVSMSAVPGAVMRGQSFPVTITMRNSGSATWSAQQFKLASDGNDSWRVSRVSLSTAPIEAIFPGQSKQFTFTATAPTTPGTYSFRWRMVREGYEFFGATTPEASIRVQ